MREQHAGELARHYEEYLEICAGLVGAERAGPKKAACKPGPKKKRAKRATRSARSKS